MLQVFWSLNTLYGTQKFYSLPAIFEPAPEVAPVYAGDEPPKPSYGDSDTPSPDFLNDEKPEPSSTSESEGETPKAKGAL